MPASTIPPHLPLLDRGSRERRRAFLDSHQLSTDTDFTLSTPYEPGANTVFVPRLPTAVRRHLRSTEHVLEVATGWVSRRTRPLVVGRDGWDVVPWGLVRPIAQVVRAARRAETVVDVAPTAFPPNDAVPDPLVADSLRRNRRLVVRHASAVHPAVLIAGLVSAFLNGRILVVVSRRRDGGHLVRQLRELGIDADKYFGGDRGGRPPRVAVGTSAGLAAVAGMLTNCSIVVVLDAVNFCGPAGVSIRHELAWLNSCWLRLVPADRVPSPLEQDRLVCMFGPSRLDIPVHGHIRRQVLFDAQPVVLPEGRGYDRVVMRLAADLAAGAVESDQFGLVGRAARVRVAGPVVVLAHDHRRRRQLQDELRAGERGVVRVVTPDELSRRAAVGVLVRADRRTQCPPLAEQVLTEPQTGRTPLLVIDAVGAADDRLLRTRGLQYRAAGWVPLAAELGGYADWDAWVHRPLDGNLPDVRRF